MKSCPRCGNTFPVERFSKNRAKADGRQTHCKSCMTDARRMWIIANPTKYRAQYRRYSRLHPKPYAPGDDVGRTLWRGYKLTVAAYNEMLERQGGRCAVCGCEPTKVRLSVDHDHDCCPGDKTCGQCVRGLVCSKCNTAMGFLGDSEERLRAAADYLAAHKRSSLERVSCVALSDNRR